MTNDPTTQRSARERIAAAQAARTAVDSQGRPTGAPATFTYDNNGLLVEATAPEDDE